MTVNNVVRHEHWWYSFEKEMVDIMNIKKDKILCIQNDEYECDLSLLIPDEIDVFDKETKLLVIDINV
jgi:hypothetical protein